MKQHILILGATGHLGRVLLKEALKKDYLVTVLVRSPDKITVESSQLTILKGDVTKSTDIEKALQGVTAVFSVLGHGFRTETPVQEQTMKTLIPLMEKSHIKRLITITGSALLEPDDPQSLLGPLLQKIARIVDPYRLNDAKAQADLLRKSDLDWTVVRTPVHRNGTRTKLDSVGFNQPPVWTTVTRSAIAHFMLKVLEEKRWIHRAPIIVS